MISLVLTLFFEIFGANNVPEQSFIAVEKEEFHQSAPVLAPSLLEENLKLIPEVITPEKEKAVLPFKKKETKKTLVSEEKVVVLAMSAKFVELPEEFKAKDVLAENPGYSMTSHEERVIDGINALNIKTQHESSKKNSEKEEIAIKEKTEEIFLEKIEELAPVIEIKKKSLPNSQNSPLPTPTKVKGIYMTGYTFHSERRRNELFKLIKKTELNTVVVDIQDPHGNLMFPVEDETVKKIKTSNISISREKFRGILAELQKAGIYTIARVTTFQDEGAVRVFPELNLKNKAGYNWKNYKGIGWLDMTNKESWEIPLKKAQESAKIGFDEVQFDYIRFPSDGRISQIHYSNLGEKKKYEVLEEFFSFLHKNKSSIGVPISADLFGVTYANYTNIKRNLAIGQRLIGAVEYFDYLSPMIYPSHYANGHMGYKNPANFPYQVVNKAMVDGHNMIKKHTDEPVSKTRPWLQAFNLGAKYNYQNIRAEIKAVDQNNASGWLLWSARNVYGQAF